MSRCDSIGHAASREIAPVPWLLSTEPYAAPYSAAAPLRLGLTTIDTAMGLDVNVVSSTIDGATLTITSDETYVTQCSDAVWNGDGFDWDSIDAADYSCQAGTGLSEIDPAPQCFNGIDDDGDGPYDRHDPDCLVNGSFAPQDNRE
jgi:hypothetical protein